MMRRLATMSSSFGWNDFTPISLIETAPFALVVSPSLPARSLGEFIAFAKSRPGKLNYGTLGAGQIPFWAALLFNSMTGIQAQEIQYKSPAERPPTS